MFINIKFCKEYLFDFCFFLVVSSEDTYTSMLGFYLHFVTMVNRHIFICIADAFTKCTKTHNPEEEQGSVTKDEIKKFTQNENGIEERIIRGWDPKECEKYLPIITLIYPIFIWTCARYHHDAMIPSTFNSLLHNITISTEPMTYFYTLIFRPGICMR